MRPFEQRLTETGSRPSFRGTSVLFHSVAISDETEVAVLETPNHHVYDLTLIDVDVGGVTVNRLFRVGHQL